MRQEEQAYSAMCDAMDSSSVVARYSDAKECLQTAMGLAQTIGEIDLGDARVERIVAAGIDDHQC